MRAGFFAEVFWGAAEFVFDEGFGLPDHAFAYFAHMHFHPFGSLAFGRVDAGAVCVYAAVGQKGVVLFEFGVAGGVIDGEGLAAALADYGEPFPGARERVLEGLDIILTAYLAARLRQQAEEQIARLEPTTV